MVVNSTRIRQTCNVFGKATLVACLSVFLAGLQIAVANPQEEKSEKSAYYYVFHRSKLDLEFSRTNYYQIRQMIPYAQLDGDGEVWVCPKRNDRYQFDFDIAIRSSKPLEKIEGVVYYPNENHSELTSSRFELGTTESVTRKEFLAALENHYRFLSRGTFTGRIWFQHRLKEILEEQGKDVAAANIRNRNFRNSLDESFEMFSGARAISENIQLDRNLINADTGDFTIDVDTIEGITIKEYDWDTVMKPELPTLDALARFIPHDQHVVFFNSLNGIEQALKEVNGFITPSLGLFSAQSVDRKVMEFYFRQMAIDLKEFAKQKSFAKVKSVAVTGSDPFSELGTDVAVLLEMSDDKSAEAFAEYYLARIKSLGPVTGIENSGGHWSADRGFSAACFHHKNLVVLSNSNFQLTRIHSVIQNKSQSLDELKEYHFFRQRYQKADDETAFAFMSDPAIRRWCGPEWRIGQSRRLRALARMQQLQAKHMSQALKLNDSESKALEVSIADTRLLGRVKLTHEGVHSTQFGTTRFVTPISHLGVDKVSEQEKAAYARWRDGYQRNWTQAFDPIGIQLKLQPKRLEVDLSVIPLILNTSYRWLARGKSMEQYAGDLHPGTLIHLAAAPGLDRMLEPYLKGLQMTEVFADDDQSFWRDFTNEKEAEEYFRKNVNKLPVALVFYFDNAENMQKALDATKVFVQPNIESETELRHRGQMYRRLKFDDPFITPDKALNLYVYKHENSAYFSLSEDLIKRAVERRLKSGRPKAIRPWLGKNLAIQLDQKFFRALEGITAEQYQRELRRLSWVNLPILNEWKKVFPDRDPIELHEKYWGETLICPGGGSYKWENDTSSYYSSAFGSPSRPRIPMGTPFPLRQVKFVDAGLSFVTDGIRARFVIEKK